MNATTLLVCFGLALVWLDRPPADLPAEVVSQFEKSTRIQRRRGRRTRRSNTACSSRRKSEEPGKKISCHSVSCTGGGRTRHLGQRLSVEVPARVAGRRGESSQVPLFPDRAAVPAGQKMVESGSSWGRQTPLPRTCRTEPSDPMNVAPSASWTRLLKALSVRSANRIYLTGLSMGGYGSWDLAESTALEADLPRWFLVGGGGDPATSLAGWLRRSGLGLAREVQRHGRASGTLAADDRSNQSKRRREPEVAH